MPNHWFKPRAAYLIELNRFENVEHRANCWLARLCIVFGDHQVVGDCVCEKESTWHIFRFKKQYLIHFAISWNWSVSVCSKYQPFRYSDKKRTQVRPNRTKTIANRLQHVLSFFWIRRKKRPSSLSEPIFVPHRLGVMR